MRVLLIEDEQSDAELLSRALRHVGFKVLYASNAEFGISVARIEEPDMALCDIHLIGMNGYEFATVCKADTQLQKMTLVAITGESDVDEVRALESGFEEIIIKSPRFEIIAARVERLMHRIQISRTVEELLDRMNRQEQRIGKLETFVKETYESLRNEMLLMLNTLRLEVGGLKRTNYLQVWMIGLSIFVGMITFILVLSK